MFRAIFAFFKKYHGLEHATIFIMFITSWLVFWLLGKEVNRPLFIGGLCVILLLHFRRIIVSELTKEWPVDECKISFGLLPRNSLFILAKDKGRNRSTAVILKKTDSAYSLERLLYLAGKAKQKALFLRTKESANLFIEEQVIKITTHWLLGDRFIMHRTSEFMIKIDIISSK